MIPWTSRGGNRLPEDLQPERPKPEPGNSNPKPEVETLMTDSPESPRGYERTDEPPVKISYGGAARYRWPNRRIEP